MPLFPNFRGGAKALQRHNRPRSVFRGAIAQGIKSAAELADSGTAAADALRGVGAARPIVDLVNQILKATGGGAGRGGGRRRGAGTADDGGDELQMALDMAEGFLREHRPELFADYHPAQQPHRGQQADTYPLQARPDNRVEARAGGRTMWIQPDDPMITGEMIQVESSNVHSIGFDWDGNSQHGTLKIRFLQSDRRQGRKGQAAGPLYEYENVHPYVFESMRTADSKGSFVWDRIRIRGTVSGHRYRYKLVGISQGYVPRQAKAYGQGGNRKEYFIGRQVNGRNVRTGEQRTFTSALPDRLVGRYQPELQALASRGMPNRGQPNRGR